ncbi:hypothetical protein INT47_000561 [Mucor saturninus]|uniref:Uncharacterized protein n=1 Tax=Mucor saturninus TaxID=64648 RepID=A0A8H7V9V7_9FUNG|nr:hypothetical protein INT47_000561 [Mucor saturninus]
MNPFDEHKTNLKNYDFWASIEEEEFGVTKYDEFLCKQKVINKQTCHDYLTTDIQYILEHFSENAKLLHHVKSLQKKLKIAGKDENNKAFWSDIAPGLMRVNNEKPAAEAELMAAGIRKAADLIDAFTSDKRKNEPPMETSVEYFETVDMFYLVKRELGIIKCRMYDVSVSDVIFVMMILLEVRQIITTRNKKKEKTKASQDMDRVEYDGLYVGENDISVGTIIRRTALQYLHESKTRNLSARERKIMTNGLSSVLDLVDHSSSSQKSLFSNEAWTQITSQFESELSLELLPMSLILTSSWLIISTNNQNKNYLKLFEHVLNLIETYPHLLKKNRTSNSDYSESDVLRIIWSPIFELLFPPNQYNLIVKTGETVSLMSQEHKQDTYSDSPNVVAFKIDIRVIFKKHGKEIDVVSGEVAKNDEDSKVITDEGKLCRETKDAVDSILTLVETKAQAFSTQISGSTCLIATQQLTRNGFYVYHPAYSFSLPSCIEELGSFKPIMQKLLSFQQHVITISNILEKAVTKKYSLNQQFGKHDEADKEGEATSILNWRRDTFYTPPKNKEARVPLVLFGLPSSGLVLRLLKTKYSEGEEGVVYDQFGWGKKNDKWHNKITNGTQDESIF